MIIHCIFSRALSYEHKKEEYKLRAFIAYC